MGAHLTLSQSQKHSLSPYDVFSKKPHTDVSKINSLKWIPIKNIKQTRDGLNDIYPSPSLEKSFHRFISYLPYVHPSPFPEFRNDILVLQFHTSQQIPYPMSTLELTQTYTE